MAHLDRLAAAGRHGALPQPRLRLGLQPPLPHRRLLPRRSAAGRRRGPPRAPRRGPRTWHAGRSSTASSTTAAVASGRSITCSRTARSRRIGSGSTSTKPSAPARAACRRSPLRNRRPAWMPSAAPGRRGARPRGEVLGYTAWWDLPALPKLDLDEPHLRALILDVAEHWLRFGIDGWRLDVAEEIDIRLLARVPRSASAPSSRTPISWPRSGPSAPNGCAGDTFDALMNYPLTEAILGFAAQGRLDADARAARGVRRQAGAPERRRPLGADRRAGRHVRACCERRSAQPPGQPRHAPGANAVWRRPRRGTARDAAPDDAAGRALHLLRRRDRHGRHHGPGLPSGLPSRSGRMAA